MPNATSGGWQAGERGITGTVAPGSGRTVLKSTRIATRQGAADDEGRKLMTRVEDKLELRPVSAACDETTDAGAVAWVRDHARSRHWSTPNPTSHSDRIGATIPTPATKSHAAATAGRAPGDLAGVRATAAPAIV